MKRIKNLFCALVVALAGTSLTGCGLFGSYKPITSEDIMNQVKDQQEEKKQKVYEDLIIEDFYGEWGYGGTLYIKGTLNNISDKKYKYVQISFGIYDEDEAIITSATDIINVIEAGGKWKFSAMGYVSNPEEVSSYKLQEITAMMY